MNPASGSQESYNNGRHGKWTNTGYSKDLCICNPTSNYYSVFSEFQLH